MSKDNMLPLLKVEEEIMNCWGIIDDLKLVYENIGGISEDELQNAILGLISLGEMKFKTLSDAFDDVVSHRHANNEWVWDTTSSFKQKENTRMENAMDMWDSRFNYNA